MSLFLENEYDLIPDIPSAKILYLPKEAAKLFPASRYQDILLASMGLLNHIEDDIDIEDDNDVVNNLLSLSTYNDQRNLGKKYEYSYLF
jgi:hypothetical protein